MVLYREKYLYPDYDFMIPKPSPNICVTSETPLLAFPQRKERR